MASDILEELDCTVGSLKTDPEIPNKGKTKKQKQKQTDPNFRELQFDDVVDYNDDDSSVEMDMTPEQDNSRALANLTATIRQQCANISDTTYQATDLEACEKASRALEEVLQTLNNSLSTRGHQDLHSAYTNNIQEEVIYGQFY